MVKNRNYKIKFKKYIEQSQSKNQIICDHFQYDQLYLSAFSNIQEIFLQCKNFQLTALCSQRSDIYTALVDVVIVKHNLTTKIL